MARLFNLDVERLNRFSRGGASLPGGVKMHDDKGGDLGSSNCPTGCVALSLNRHGIKGKQGHAIYTAFLGG